MEQGELGSRERESDDWMEGLLLERGGRIRIRESNKERDNEGRSVRETEADDERARARVCVRLLSVGRESKHHRIGEGVARNCKTLSLTAARASCQAFT